MGLYYYRERWNTLVTLHTGQSVYIHVREMFKCVAKYHTSFQSH